MDPVQNRLQKTEKHAEYARELFYEGYNCAQSVFCAFCDKTGLGKKQAARLASSFGGGIGRMREVCGAVSGAVMVLGMVCGYDDPEDKDAKKTHYERVRTFARRFREAEGSIICRELLLKVGSDRKSAESGGDPEERTEAYYKKRPCPELVFRAAAVLEEMLEEEERNRKEDI